MKISKIFLSGSLLVLGYSAVAQDNYLQVTQTPLLLNPSIAGGKAKNRISAAYNKQTSNMSGNDYKNSTLNRNAYISYDWLMKKHGFGAGVYYAFNQRAFDDRLNLQQDRWEKEGLKYSGLNATKNNRIGLSIAPKYNVKSNKEYNKVIYTFSPSIFLEYTNSKLEYDHHYELVKTLIYNSSYPDGKVISDSLRYYQTNINSNILKTGIGLQWNTNSFILLYKATFEMGNSKEQMDLTTLNRSQIKEVQSTFNFNKTLYSLEHNIVIGKTFPAN